MINSTWNFIPQEIFDVSLKWAVKTSLVKVCRARHCNRTYILDQMLLRLMSFSAHISSRLFSFTLSFGIYLKLWLIKYFIFFCFWRFIITLFLCFLHDCKSLSSFFEFNFVDLLDRKTQAFVHQCHLFRLNLELFEYLTIHFVIFIGTLLHERVVSSSISRHFRLWFIISLYHVFAILI